MGNSVLGDTGTIAKVIDQLNALYGAVVSLTTALLNGSPKYSKDYSVNVNGNSVQAFLGVFTGIPADKNFTTKAIDFSIFPELMVFFYLTNIDYLGNTYIDVESQDYHGNWLVVDSLSFQTQLAPNSVALPTSLVKKYPYRLPLTRFRIRAIDTPVTFNVSISVLGGNSN